MEVYAKNQAMVKLLRHPTAGGFIDTKTAAHWPDDTFTYRRLRDGDILDKPPQEESASAAAPVAGAAALVAGAAAPVADNASSDAAQEAAPAPEASTTELPEANNTDNSAARRRKS